MKKERRFVLVDEQVLPTIFQKVLQAKEYLLKDKAQNLTEACKMADVSRSAFYKYKDCITYYEEGQASREMTFYLKLSDEPGVLSAVLTVLSEYKANIITLNQNVPSEAVARVTITVRMDTPGGYEMLMENLGMVHGVYSIRRL